MRTWGFAIVAVLASAQASVGERRVVEGGARKTPTGAWAAADVAVLLPPSSCAEARIFEAHVSAFPAGFFSDLKREAFLGRDGSPLVEPALLDGGGWRTVAARFDPCPKPHPGGTGAGGVPRRVAGGFPHGSCRAEFRVVVQPVIDFATGPQVLDAAIHLVFDVPDIETGLAALRPLREARLRSRAGADAWIPHPALSDARACGSDGMRAFTHATSKLARPERLTRVAWSFLEADGGSWTFEGEDLVDPSDARSEEGFFLTGARPGREPLDGDAAPGARGSPRHADFNRWFLGTSDPEGALRDTAFDVLDPEVVSAAPGRPDSASCVECHVGQGVLFHYDLMTDRAVDLGRERLGRLARLDGHVPALLSEKCPLLRGLGNMRAFGYGPGGECGVSLRTVAEVESALRFLNAPPAR